MSILHRHASSPALSTEDPALCALRDRLRSLHDNCLSDLARGLGAMKHGDLTVEVEPATQAIAGAVSGDPVVRELIELFNAMLRQAQAALAGYNDLREQLQAALGPRSCLDELQARMRSLADHCLTDLATGLTAVAEGDLTVEAEPVTRPLDGDPEEIGALALTFNAMLAHAQGGSTATTRCGRG